MNYEFFFFTRVKKYSKKHLFAMIEKMCLVSYKQFVGKNHQQSTSRMFVCIFCKAVSRYLGTYVQESIAISNLIFVIHKEY
jgi:hypothetical protein